MFLSFIFLEQKIMKNLIVICIIAAIGYGVWNYTEQQKQIEDAKQELWVTDSVDDTNQNTQNPVVDENDSWDSQVENNENNEDEKIEPEVEDKIEIFTIKYLTDNEFIQLDQLQESDLVDGKIEISGKTLVNVDSIRVTFENKDSSYPNDDYTLNQFSAWDDTFLYRAFSQYQVFDYGTNVYQFIAKSGDEESILELTIYNPEEKLDQLENVNTMDIDISGLPTGAQYGNPVKVSESSVSYSDIPGLEISAVKDLEFECSNDYILSQTNRLDLGTIWWNTCRPNENETGISYFVLSVDEAGIYTYAKHYVSKNYYGILELEQADISTSWDSLETQSEKDAWLKEKNNELKAINDDFTLVEVTNNLFNEITK